MYKCSVGTGAVAHGRGRARAARRGAGAAPGLRAGAGRAVARAGALVLGARPAAEAGERNHTTTTLYMTTRLL